MTDFSVIDDMLDLGIVKFGDFLLKSGKRSNIYFDLRSLVSYPKLFRDVCDKIAEKCDEVDTDYVCGLPYTGIPIATRISFSRDIPMMLLRKERKTHGTGKMVEGDETYNGGDECVLIDDVITRGTTILESVKILQQECPGLVIKNVVVLIDRRESEGSEFLEGTDIRVHSVFKLCDIQAYWNSKQTRDIFSVVERKRSNLCVAVDVSTMSDLLSIARTIGDKICILKTHIDIVEDFSLERAMELKELARKMDFLIMEDRKFADIGALVEKQLNGGIYKISSWADLVTTHVVMGSDSWEIIGKSSVGIVTVLDASSFGNLLGYDIYPSTNIAGYVAQSPRDNLPDTPILTPGIKFYPGSYAGMCGEIGGDGMGQMYRTPESVIVPGKTIAIVGRGILHSGDIVETAEMYRKECFRLFKGKIE